MNPALLLCAAMLANPLSGEHLLADVERYASLGIHQTGSEGDRATSDWLGSELAAAGYTVERQSFQFTRFELEHCSLRLGETWVDTFPFWFPRETPDDGIEGQLVPWNESESLSGKVVFVSAEQAGREPYYSSVNAWAVSAAARGAFAVVVEVPSASGEIAAINAVEPYVETPLPIPSVIVGNASRSAIAQAIDENQSARIVVQGATRPGATATNVVARIERGPKWLVVTTPSSGWFTCGGERGPGVALFLGLARYLAETEAEYSLLFMANSGHELGTLGAHASLNASALEPEDVVCWIHLGASIATRQWRATDEGAVPLADAETGGNLFAVESLLPLVQQSFAEVSWLAPRSTGPVAGELAHFVDAGYPAFGFFGPHFYFHTQNDTAATTSPELLAPIGEALRRVVESL